MAVRRAGIGAALVIAAVLLAGCGGGPARNPVRYAAAACPADVGAAPTCGWLTVPLRHDAAGGPTTKLLVVTYHPTRPAAADPVVVLGGHDLGEPVRYGDDDAPLPDRIGRDVIVLETRGTGHTRPALGCPSIDALDRDPAGAALTTPAGAAAFRAAVAACWTALVRAGVDPGAYTLAESAADVADLRSALHLSSFDLGGYGYGSRIAFEVLRRFPQGVRAAYLDSPELPGQSVFTTTVTGTIAALNAPGRLGEFDAAVARADAEPGGLDGATVARAIRDFASFAPASVNRELAALVDGRSTDVTAYLAEARATCVGYLTPCTRTDPPIALGEVLTVLCHDEVPAPGAPTDIRPSLAGAYGNDPWLAACAAWPVGHATTGQRSPVRSNVPILLMRGAIDPYTLAASEADLLGLPHAYPITFPGLGTHPLGAGDARCGFAIRAAFLADPTDRPDTACLGASPTPR